MKQPVVLAHEVEQAFRGHHRKGEGVEERDIGPRGISLERGRGRCRKHVSVMWEKGRTDAGWVDGGR
jgi:hypothetical protein